MGWKIGQGVHRERGLHHLSVQRTRERNLPLNVQFLLPTLRQKGGLGLNTLRAGNSSLTQQLCARWRLPGPYAPTLWEHVATSVLPQTPDAYRHGNDRRRFTILRTLKRYRAHVTEPTLPLPVKNSTAALRPPLLFLYDSSGEVSGSFANIRTA